MHQYKQLLALYNFNNSTVSKEHNQSLQQPWACQTRAHLPPHLTRSINLVDHRTSQRSILFGGVPLSHIIPYSAHVQYIINQLQAFLFHHYILLANSHTRAI